MRAYVGVRVFEQIGAGPVVRGELQPYVVADVGGQKIRGLRGQVRILGDGDTQAGLYVRGQLMEPGRISTVELGIVDLLFGRRTPLGLGYHYGALVYPRP